MGIEPTSVAWEATVMAIIRRPQRTRFYAGSHPHRNYSSGRGACGAITLRNQMPNMVMLMASRVTIINSTWTITNRRIGERSIPPRRGNTRRSGSRNGAVIW